MSEVRPEALLHLAWCTDHGAFWSSPENLRWVASSLELLQVFHRAGGRRWVGAGTCAEYDWRFGFCSEAVTPLAPATLYGRSKQAVWSVVEGFASSADLAAAWGRVFFLFGAGEPAGRLVPSVASALLRGEHAACTAGTQLRDFLYVDDVAAGFVALLESDVDGAVNIASGTPVSVASITRMIGRIIGRPELVELGALPDRAAEPPLLAADVRRLADEVGFRPGVGLEEGLRRTIGALGGGD